MLAAAVASMLVLAGAYAASRVLGRPTFVFANDLAGTVRLTIGDSSRLVPPGDTVRARVPRRALVAGWALVRPLSADDRPMGEEMQDSWAVPNPRGTMARAAEARTDTADYFAPLITNATNGLLRITVNAGLAGALDCGCAVRPGAQRVFIGYYRLYGNSTVRAADSAGHTAEFRDVGPVAEARNRVVGLRFNSENFPAR